LTLKKNLIQYKWVIMNLLTTYDDFKYDSNSIKESLEKNSG